MKDGIIIILVAMICLSSIPCWAEEDAINSNTNATLNSMDFKEKDTAITARIIVAKKITGFTAGYLAGYAFHDAGHFLVALIEDAKQPHISGATFKSIPSNPESSRHIAIGGFSAQILSTEIILDIDAIPKDNSFVLGWLTFNIMNTVSYVIADTISNDICEDFKSLRTKGVNTDIIKVALLAHTALSVYRIYKNPKFIPYVNITKNEVIAGLAWQW
jgi:hypothetical protein